MYDQSAIVAEVRLLLERKPCSSLNSISCALQVDRHTINSFLRDSSETTFLNFRKAILLRKGHELLSERPASSIKEIAIALGYGSGRAFTRAFKEASGSAPSTFRSRAMHGHDY